jgi:hypothetical protein
MAYYRDEELVSDSTSKQHRENSTRRMLDERDGAMARWPGALRTAYGSEAIPLRTLHMPVLSPHLRSRFAAFEASPDGKSPSHSSTEAWVPAKSRAMPTFEESSAFRGAASWAAPPIYQQKPGMQLFFFRKTTSSAWLPSSHRHGCSAFADWLRPTPACGI